MSSTERSRLSRERKRDKDATDATDARCSATDARCSATDATKVEKTALHWSKNDQTNSIKNQQVRDATATLLDTDTDTDKDKDKEEKIKDNATGLHPVASPAQARATPATDPPVDNFPEPQGLATASDAEPEKTQPFPAENPAETQGFSGQGTAEPAEPDKPPAAAKRKKAPPGLSVAEVVAECAADPQHVQDWFVDRRAKGAPVLSPTAWDGFKRESGKAGISPAEAIRICAENGWRGFKASWYANQTASHGTALARASPHVRNPLVPWEAAQAAQNQAILLAKRKIFGEVIDATV